ncbi:MAG: tetratricopeptide repeat protein [Alphaproteobacteria bacterium]|nr:tetratricopeptide repeat protein [Alphaproteobacteria bacterium]
MAIQEGRYGLTYTTARPDAVMAFDRMVSSYLGFGRDIGNELKQVLAADPDMPMGHVAKGYLFKLFGSGAMAERAKSALAAARSKADAAGMNDREAQHLAALEAWCAEDIDETTRCWERIVVDHPKDVLALRLAHFNHFYAGEGRMMRDSTARVLPEWSADDPDYGFLLGMHAFGLEEAGEYAQAEAVGREAVERNPGDAWAVHAVAHVLEMQGRHREGVDWVKGLEPSWSSTNNFRFHLYWHQALFHLERHEFDAVLALYDRQIASDLDADMYLDVCNGASLLWRLEMYGVDVGARWKDLARISMRHVEDHELVFVSLHYLMALIKGGEPEAAAALAGHLERYASASTTQGRVAARVGTATAAAMAALAKGDAVGTVEALHSIRYDLYCIGGSHAQRDVFEEMLVSAAVEADARLARALLAERTAAKPTSAWSWRKYAEALNAIGRQEAADGARARAEALLARD